MLSKLLPRVLQVLLICCSTCCPLYLCMSLQQPTASVPHPRPAHLAFIRGFKAPPFSQVSLSPHYRNNASPQQQQQQQLWQLGLYDRKNRPYAATRLMYQIRLKTPTGAELALAGATNLSLFLALAVSVKT